MKEVLDIYSIISVILFLIVSSFALIAQTNTRASAAISSGWYHTFQNTPEASDGAGADPHFESKYDLKERWPFAIELLFHHVFSDESDATRIGFRFIFLSVRQMPKLGSQFYVNLSEQQPRLYRNTFLSGVIQRKVYDYSRSQILLDLSMGLSFISVKRESGYEGNTEFRLPEMGIGIQIGFGYLFRFLEKNNTLNYIRISPRCHFQTGNSFPFSSGFLLDIGIVVQLADED